MQDRIIDIPKLYKYSFQQFKKYASFIIGITITYYVLGVVPQIYYVLLAPENPTGGDQLLSFLLTLVQLYLGVGFIKIMLLLIQDEFVNIADLFNNIRIFLSYSVGTFLYAIAVLIGLFLLIAPGVYLAVRLLFYPYFIIENGDNSFTALHKSFEITRELTLELFLFGITVLFLNILGAFLFGIGVIVTYPLTTMATAVVYRSLISNTARIPSDPYILPD